MLTFRQKLKYGAVAVLTSAPMLAMADSISDEVTSQGAKIAGYAGLMVLAGLGVWAAKAAGRKMGWWL